MPVFSWPPKGLSKLLLYPRKVLPALPSTLPAREPFTIKYNGTLSSVPKTAVVESKPVLPVVSQALAADNAVLLAFDFHSSPVLYQNDCVVLSYTSKPLVGGIARRAALLMRGIRMPLLFDFTSRMALASAKEPSALIARFCP